MEVSKPDYLSLVNEGGSGFNVSELVTSIVASEIEPHRILQTSKLEKTEDAISGIGFLNSQASKTQTNFQTISGDNFFNITSSASTAVQVNAVDETSLSNGNRIISEVSIAKNMVFELGGFTDLTTTYSASLSIDFGTWSKIEAQSDSATDTYSAGKTYIANSIISNGQDVNDISRDTNWPGSGSVAVGDFFTVNSGVGDNILGSGAVITETDKFSFTDSNVSRNESITFANETLTQVAARLNSISGISAQVIDTNGDGSSYSLVVSGDDTGADNGFKITEVSSSIAGRWTTTDVPASDAIENNFSQLAKDATFKLDGVTVSRRTNNISGLINGAIITLKADRTEDATITFSRSEQAIRQNINDTIFSLNEFKSEIDRLTYIDVDEGPNGPLAMEAAATILKSNFKRLALDPIKGFGSEAIYLSQLGIKTNSSGTYYFDETTFEKTLSNNPGYFSILKDANLSSNSESVTVTKSQFTKIPPETYLVSNVSGVWKFGDANLTKQDLDSGGSRFTSTDYPGLLIETTQSNPDAFQVHVGKSFAEKIIDLMADTLDFGSSLKSVEDSYKEVTIDITERLASLDEREKLISSRYTEQFGKMEQAMTKFNSTKSLLENFIKSWETK